MRRTLLEVAAATFHVVLLVCVVLLNLGGYQKNGGTPVFSRTSGVPVLADTYLVSWQYVYTVFPSASSNPVTDAYAQVPLTVYVYLNAVCITNSTSTSYGASTDYICLYNALGHEVDYSQVRSLSQAYFLTGFQEKWDGSFVFYYPLPGQEVEGFHTHFKRSEALSAQRRAIDYGTAPRHLLPGVVVLIAAAAVTVCGWLAHICTGLLPKRTWLPSAWGIDLIVLLVFGIAAFMHIAALAILGLASKALESGVPFVGNPGEEVTVRGASKVFWGLLIGSLLCQWAGVLLYIVGQKTWAISPAAVKSRYSSGLEGVDSEYGPYLFPGLGSPRPPEGYRSVLGAETHHMQTFSSPDYASRQ
ncbi:hypothetical protein GQ53DRAFT_829191 [Thozetella sp. PMI_491]|nr:hypothetical protein GQ53DRAFT_829191 [Thozetella sp. PMI_491]